MLSCLKPLPPPSTNSYFSSPASQGYSAEDTPRSSAQPSHTINITREYTLAVQTSSYGEIRRTFDQDISFDLNGDTEHIDVIEGALEQVLQPSRECVQETLSIIGANPLTYLVASYFERSEETSRLCFSLYQSVRRAHLMYTPVHNLLDDLPLEFDSDSYSLSDFQCNSTYNVFLKFDCLENPFLLSHDSQNFDDMRQCFSQLRHELDHRSVKPRSRGHLPHYCSTGSALCLVAAAVGVAISAVAIATHALVALAGSPICLALFPSNMIRKENVNLQLDEASRSVYVLHRDLDTIDRLVAQLHADVENDKFFIRQGMESGMDRYLVQEILKQLRRNRPSFVERLSHLEDNLFLCFAAINRTRLRILQEIQLHQHLG